MKHIPRKLITLMAACMLACCAAFLAGCDDDIDIDYGTDDGKTSTTVMIYMIGSDLESQGGAATDDLLEMCKANYGERVNVVIEAGGAKKWQNNVLKNKEVARLTVSNGDVQVQQELGKKNMADPDTLANFIKWAKKNYPASRYDLILWNHGGGTILGFGYDEMYPDDMMDLAEITQALKKSKTKFDFIGFDACLMGTVETAYAMAPYANYLIASEESEPGTGWYYTHWLDALGDNPAADTEALGTRIIHDFVFAPNGSFFDDNTLSMVKLSKVDKIYKSLCEYLSTSNYQLEHKGYKKLAKARSKSKSYGEGGFEQIDIIDYLDKAGLPDCGVQKAIENAIVYQDSNIPDSNGLAMYYPYDAPEYYAQVLKTLKQFGMAKSEYQAFFKKFISITINGQKSFKYSKTLMEALTNTDDDVSSSNNAESGDYNGESWYENPKEDDYSTSDYQTVGKDDIKLVKKGDEYYIHLSDKQWDDITNIDMQVYLDDGKGYIDLGRDNIYDFDDSGDLLVEYDYLWVSMDGQIVPYYDIEQVDYDDGSWRDSGYIPAKLNGNTNVEVMVFYDPKHEDGYVAGYRLASSSDNIAIGITPYARDIIQFEKGDTLSFAFDYYTYKGTHKTFSAGDELVYDGSNFKLSLEDVGDYGALVSMRLTDVFNNELWSEPLEYK